MEQRFSGPVHRAACESGGLVRSAPDDDEYIFPSRRATPKDCHNYLRHHLKQLAAGLGVPSLTFQTLYRTFATLMQGKSSPKDAQTELRHRDILTMLHVYTQSIPESVKRPVEALDSELLKMLGEFGRESEALVQSVHCFHVRP
jgi:integrase